MIKILLVEDNSLLRDFLLILLERNNFEVRSASSRNELNIWLRTFTPDIILLDVLLEEDSGRDICREMKETNKTISIILMSSNPQLLVDYNECNADDIIEKPFKIDDVLAKIANVLVRKNLL